MRIDTSQQCRFWFSDHFGLIRQRSVPGRIWFPEIWRDGRWRSGTPAVMDAITGLGEDPWSCGEWSQAWDATRATAYASQQGIDLLATNADAIASVRCRVAACREPADGGPAWGFYLLNDGDSTLNAVLDAVEYTWGDDSRRSAVDVRIANLAPGAHARLWRDDGELRLALSLCIHNACGHARQRFDFPLLYRRDALPPVPGLGRPGWAVSGVID